MNRCRSDGGKQPRVIRCSKGEYGFLRSKFGPFYENFGASVADELRQL